jgi:heme oxygenase (biliverdin-IX-beta and delta-forming)
MTENPMLNSSVTPDLMLALREKTRIYHTALETVLDVSARCTSVISYRTLLAQFYGFYRPMEERLHDFPEWAALGFPLLERRKLPLLTQDLQALGMSETDLENLPVCNDLPVLTKFASAMGCLYVIEGSTLGSQYVSRLLQERLRLDARNGGAFFYGYGDRTGIMWKAFGGFANNWVASQPTEDDVIYAATETFKALERWFI